MHTNQKVAAIFQWYYSGGGGTAYEPEYQHYLDTLASLGYAEIPPEVQVLQNKYMKGLKQIGLNKFDVVRVFANHASNIARVNFVNPTVNHATSVGSPSFLQYNGFVSNGSPNRVSENANLSSYTAYQQNNAHVYGYFLTYTSGMNASHGVALSDSSSTQIQTVRVPPSGNPLSARITLVNLLDGTTQLPSEQMPLGKSLCTTRNSATETASFVDGGSKWVKTDATSAAVIDSHFSWLCRTNFDGNTNTYIHFTNGETVSVGTLGGALTDDEVLHLHNITEEYVETVRLL